MPNLMLVRKHKGVLSKRIFADESGKPVSDGSACVLGSGTAEVKAVPNLDDLATLIGTMKSSTALLLGTPKDQVNGAIKIVTAANEDKGTDGVSRSLRNIHFEPGKPAYMLIDVDYKGAPGKVMEAVNASGVWPILCETSEGMTQVGRVTRPSTSSGLRNQKTDEVFGGSGGQHIYVPITDGADMQRAVTVMAKRLWLAGYGWIMISKAGSQLIRTLVDVSVAMAARYWRHVLSSTLPL